MCSISPDLQIFLNHKWFECTGRGGSASEMPFEADTNDFHMNTLLSNDGEGVRSRLLDIALNKLMLF